MATNVKVSLERVKGYHPNGSRAEREKWFRIMFNSFNREVDDLGIKDEFKERQSFSTNNEKTRKKRKAAVVRRRQEEILRSRKRK